MNDYFGKHLYLHKAGGAYTHHGLGIGNDHVIHYSGLANDLNTDGKVETLEIEEFAQGEEILVLEHEHRRYNRTEVVQRALSRLGEKQYHVLHNNCEHFVNWCITGEHISPQAQSAKLICTIGIGARILAASTPAGMILGAVGTYAWMQYSLRNRPELQELEENYQRMKQEMVYLPT